MRLARFLVFLSLAAAGQEIVIHSATTIDPASGSVSKSMDVLISGGRIQAVGVVARPSGSLLVDGRGKFMIPGLWDMHVHLWHSENQPELYVAFGVTGVRDMGSDLSHTLALRQSIEAGLRAGPHVITSGPGVDGRAPADPHLPVILADSPQAARLAVDQGFDSGADFIKVFSSIPLESYLALAERARQLRIPFVGHLPGAVRLEDAIDLRQASIEHFFGMERANEARLRRAFQAAALRGTRFTPTLSMHRRELGLSSTEKSANCLVLPAIRNDWPRPAASSPELKERALRSYAHFEEMVRWLHEAGVPILAGTDTGDAFSVPGASLQEELELLSSTSLSTMDVLKIAASEPPRFLGSDGSTGVIRSGAYADLVLLDQDPLQDLRNLRKVSGVWVKGRYYDRASIEGFRRCLE